MRLEKPRLEPRPLDEIDPEIRGQIEANPLNIFRTLAHHPKLMKRWLVFGNHVLAKSSLEARERELVILGVGWRCRAGYEWGQHEVIGRASGLTDEEIQRIADGPDAPGWDPFDAALLRAVDELHDDTFISDSTWATLSERYDSQQMLDLIFAIGQYHVVSMALNSLGVQLDDGFRGLPER